MPRREKKTSPWVWVAVGCGGIVLLAIAAVATFAFVVFRDVREIQADVEDPKRRAERTKQILGYEELPAGYHPLSLRIPLVGGTFAMLSDTEMNADGEFQGDPRHVFVLFRPSWLIRRDRELRAVLEGGARPFTVLEEADVFIDRAEQLGDGTLEIPGARVRWEAQRVRLYHEAERLDGDLAMFVVECAGKGRSVGGWLTPSDEPGASAPEALSAFLSQFELCRR